MEYITTNIVIAVIFRTIVLGENMRWVRARSQGMRGTSVSFGLFVDWVLIIGQSLWYLFLVAFAFDTSIFSSVILFLVALLTAAVSGLNTLRTGRDWRAAVSASSATAVASVLITLNWPG